MKKLNKKSKIIIAVIASVLFVAGLSLGLYFGLQEKPHETEFSTIGEVKIIDKNNIVFSYTCPYLSEDTSFRIEDKNGFVITYKAKDETRTIPCTITSSKYEPSKSETVKYGTLSLDITLKEDIKEDTTYNALLSKDSISLKKEKYTNPDITADFSVSKSEEGLFEVQKEEYIGSKLIVPSDVEVKLTKEKGKAFCTVTAQIDGITTYNKEGLSNIRTLIFFRYKTEDGTTFRLPLTNKKIEFSSDNGKVTFKYEIEEKDLIPGYDYDFTIQKGFFTNEDKSIINDEYTGTFTYVE